MPISPFGFTGIIAPNLASVAVIGVDMPKFARGLAIGYSTYLQKIQIQTTDGGTAGTGKGTPMPLVVPPPVWYPLLTTGFTKNRIMGLLAPTFILGLSNGLSLCSLQALTNTVHFGVGVGAGVPTINPPPAFTDIQLGFKQVGFSGPDNVKVCRAIAFGIEKSLRTFIIPIPIVGPPSPSPGTGRGTGKFV